ncbi:MAG TPA: Gfo/Idh/MocA family oxidoreductase, partial [Candidatus Avipropionibacterium avicola]|nr:Gfo/Idh/MocA family oxidoreductase [Candidatus Avipropionibacterium avicola]
ALEAGKHVLCEARMARDVAEARVMTRAAHARPDLVCQIVPSPFTLTRDATVLRLLSDGAIGELVQVEVAARSGWVDPAAERTWRQSREISGVNVMALGIWYEALMRWVGEATRVSALARTVVPRRPDQEGILRTVDVPDHLDVIAELAGGAHLRMVLSQAIAGAEPDGVRLYGTAGTLQLTGDGLSLSRPGAEAEDVPVPEDAAGWRVEEEFVGAIRGTEPVRHTTVDDALRYMLFTEAVHRSVHEHRQVSLSEL